MPKYEIVRPYNHTVKVGDVIEVENLHPSLKAHVKLADSKAKVSEKKIETPKAPQIKTPATPSAKPPAEMTAAEKRAKALAERKAAAQAEDEELTAEQLEALHDEAIAEDGERFPVEE